MDRDFFFSNLNLKKERECFFFPVSFNGCLDGGISKGWTT
jgi:hypothetical protein